MGIETEQGESLLNSGEGYVEARNFGRLSSLTDYVDPERYGYSAFPTIGSKRRRWPVAVISATIVMGFLYFLSHLYGRPLFRSEPIVEEKKLPTLIAGTNFTKPADLQIVGILFYGRRDRVSILDCYLKKNLAVNGGILDEIQFMTMTENEGDLAWLDQAVASTPGYKKMSNPDKPKLEWFDGYNTLQRGVLYVKIDDDVVFIGNDTIPRMVRTAIEQPDILIVAANTINSPLISWVHYKQGAILPFLPELQPPVGVPLLGDVADWRPSKLPEWHGPDNFTFDFEKPAPFEGHRWLPLKAGTNIDRTPIANAEYSAFGKSWKDWGIAAQQHYSFFSNMETDPSLAIYKFEAWKTDYDRLSINLIVFKGEDIIDNGPVPGEDEPYLTVDLPKKLHRHVVIDGHAMAAHYTFGPQHDHEGGGMGYTDVLARYRSYAHEMVCERPAASQATGTPVATK